MRPALALALALTAFPLGCRPAPPPPEEGGEAAPAHAGAAPSPAQLLARAQEELARLGSFGADVRTVVIGADQVWEGEGLLRMQRPDKASWTVLGGLRSHLSRTDGRYVWVASPDDRTYAVQLPPAEAGDIPARLRLPLAGWLFLGGGWEGAPGRAWGGTVEGPLVTVGEEVVDGEPCWRVDGWLRLGEGEEGVAGLLSVWFAKGDGLVRRTLSVVGQADTEGWDPVRLAESFSAQGSSEEIYRRLERDAMYPLMTFRYVVPRDFEKIEIPWRAPEGGPTGGLVSLEEAVLSAMRGKYGALASLSAWVEGESGAGGFAGRLSLVRGEPAFWEGEGEPPDTLAGRMFSAGVGTGWPPLDGWTQRPGWLLLPDEEVDGALCYSLETWWTRGPEEAARLRLLVSQDHLHLIRAEFAPGGGAEADWPAGDAPAGWTPAGAAWIENYSQVETERQEEQAG